MRSFVINLERSHDRRAAMQSVLRDAGLDVEFFPAVDGRALDRRLYPQADGMNAGELGCYLSNVRIWQWLADPDASGDCDSVLVFEDDVEISPALGRLCEDLRRLPLQIDMVRLASLMPCVGIGLLSLDGHHRLLVPSRNPSGTQGYWLSRAGARRLLACYGTPRRPIDKQLDLAWRDSLRVLLLDPPAVRPREGVASTIGPGLRQWRSARWLRKLRKWRQRRAAQRLARRLHRELHAAGRPAAGTGAV